MGTIKTAIDSAFRDFNTEGVSSSGAHDVVKSDVRAVGPLIEQGLANASLGGLVGVAYATRAELEADLAHGAGTTGLVYADDTDANNDLYLKSGASGSGSWTLTTAFHDALGRYATDAAIAAEVALAAAASADYRAARGAALVAAVQAAAGDASAVKLLLTADGAKSYRDGSVTDIAGIVPLIGPAAISSEVGFDGSGPSPAPAAAPIEVAGGIQFHHKTGFVIDDGLIASTGDFAIDMVIEWPAVAATYADTTALAAALGDHPVGTLVYVEDPVMAIDGWPDQPLLLATGVTSAAVTGGYYLRGNGAWSKHSAYLLAGTDSDGHRCEIQVDNVGKLTAFVYDGTHAASAIQYYRDILAFAPGKPQSLRLESDGEAVTLFWNGEEVGTHYMQAPFAPGWWFVNGNAHTGGTGTGADPVQDGASYTLGALCVTQGLDYTRRRQVSDALAEAFGTPLTLWSPIADVVVNIDQSRTSGAELGTAGDPNRPDAISGWNGQLTRRYANDLLGPNPSQEVIPGVYSSGDVTPAHGDRGAQFGPLSCALNGYGDPSSSASFTQSGSGTETIEWGFAKQWRLAEGARANHLYFIGLTVGGQPLSYFQNATGDYLHGLGNISLDELEPRDWVNRAVLMLRQRCRARGQKLRLVALSNLQAEYDVTTAGIAAAHEADLRQWWDEELSQIVDLPSPPPLMLFKCPAYSGDGTGLTDNVASSNYAADAYRRLGLNRDNGHRIRVLTSIYAWCGRFIHWCAPRIRLVGEVMGDLARRAWHEGKDDSSVQVVDAVRSGGNVVLTLNRPVEIVSEALPTVLGTLTTGGHDTYGIVFEPVSGGRTISGDVTLDGTGLIITVPISGGGPIAGDRINVTGTGARWTNFRAVDRRFGLYPDQNWPAMPFADAAPDIDLTGDLNELTEWLAPSSHVLA